MFFYKKKALEKSPNVIVNSDKKSLKPKIPELKNKLIISGIDEKDQYSF